MGGEGASMSYFPSILGTQTLVKFFTTNWQGNQNAITHMHKELYA